jgi:hypothetical protein
VSSETDTDLGLSDFRGVWSFIQLFLRQSAPAHVWDSNIEFTCKAACSSLLFSRSPLHFFKASSSSAIFPLAALPASYACQHKSQDIQMIMPLSSDTLYSL